MSLLDGTSLEADLEGLLLSIDFLTSQATYCSLPSAHYFV